MILPVLRRPVLAAISIISYMTYNHFVPSYKANSTHNEVHTDAYIEDCPECEQVSYPQTYIQGKDTQLGHVVSTTATTTPAASPASSSFIPLETQITASHVHDSDDTVTLLRNATIPISEPTEVSQLYDFSRWIDYFLMLTALWPVLRYLPNRRKSKNSQQQKAQKETLINELQNQIDTFETIKRNHENRINELVHENSLLHESKVTFTNLVAKREQEVENEKEKVNIYMKHHLAFSDARTELQYAMSRLQEENNLLREYLKKSSSQYQRVIAELPSLLIPLHNMATSQPFQPRISFASKEGSVNNDSQTIHSVSTSNHGNTDATERSQDILRDFLRNV